MREKLMRFMQGRYGVDQFGRFLSGLTMVLLILSLFSRFRLLYVLALASLIYSYFRMFSKNTAKRYAENQKYLVYTFGVRRALGRKKNELMQSRTHHIYRCPSCRQKIRIPKGRGRVEVRCPKCNTTFIKKS